ncbi:MAG TPA: hypothetical protein VKB08_09445 [Bradyrhizobium sp.]|nr:hypothetical protein [Bradyrhizobium sp.]
MEILKYRGFAMLSVTTMISATLWVFAAEAQTANVVGLGAIKCSEFSAEIRSSTELEREYFAWAQGFMSGILIRSPAGVDEGLELNPPAFPLLKQADFVRQFCQDNPSKSYNDGVVALYRILRNVPRNR